eukprot:350318-Chlamydomonas_euryale.AAC.16
MQVRQCIQEKINSSQHLPPPGPPTTLNPSPAQKMSNTPEELTLRWGSATFEHLMRLFYTADAPRAGVFLSYAHHVLSEPEPPPAWTNIVHSFGPMDPKHLALLPARYKHGYSYGTVM